jgi:RNA polymerase sigma-70 factor (ECF subfamily)
MGDFDLAEDAVQEAFATAMVRWERDGIPDHPEGWFLVTARNKRPVAPRSAPQGDHQRGA